MPTDRQNAWLLMGSEQVQPGVQPAMDADSVHRCAVSPGNKPACVGGALQGRCAALPPLL